MLVLASQSPRRRHLLEQIGLPFTVDASSAEEEAGVAHLPPPEQARTLALIKARDVAARHPGDLVLGADTIVVLGDQVLNKPADAADAVRMLSRLQGRAHRVITGVALLGAGQELVAHEITTVWIRPLTRTQIERYVNTGEPLDKAGAYGIQGRAAALVERIEGCYYNVVGLPLARVVRMLAALGWEVL